MTGRTCKRCGTPFQTNHGRRVYCDEHLTNQPATHARRRKRMTTVMLHLDGFTNTQVAAWQGMTRANVSQTLHHSPGPREVVLLLTMLREVAMSPPGTYRLRGALKLTKAPQ